MNCDVPSLKYQDLITSGNCAMRLGRGGVGHKKQGPGRHSQSWRYLPPPVTVGSSGCHPTDVPRVAQRTYRCTAGVREARPPKLAEMVLISICFRAEEPSALRWNM